MQQSRTKALEPGSEFGSYLVEGLIAGGGMGQVYAAQHKVYASPVALKVLHTSLHADEDWRKRFNVEALVGQQLKHPHVLAARELVEHDGRVAIVLDLVRGGQTLERVMAREFREGMALSDALKVLLGILQGVEYAHGKGIVHADIKPENVLIEGEFNKPTTWVPKVTDFGTAGLIAHPVVIDGRAAVVATPRYAAPEHLYGVDHVSVQSDIYCLGLLLYFLLTGQHISTARTVKEAAEFVQRPMPLVGLVDHPDSLISLFQRATMLDQTERFQSCRDFALAVREVLEGIGAGLDLEDLQADLATEIMEERVQARQELRQQTGGDPFAGGDSHTDTTIVLRDPIEIPSPQGSQESEADLPTEMKGDSEVVVEDDLQPEPEPEPEVDEVVEADEEDTAGSELALGSETEDPLSEEIEEPEEYVDVATETQAPERESAPASAALVEATPAPAADPPPSDTEAPPMPQQTANVPATEDDAIPVWVWPLVLVAVGLFAAILLMN